MPGVMPGIGVCGLDQPNMAPGRKALQTSGCSSGDPEAEQTNGHEQAPKEVRMNNGTMPEGASGTTRSSRMFDPSAPGQWTSINWGYAERVVARLQHRIALAMSKGQHRRVRDLQRLLTKSLAARLIAVRRVAQENKGKRTPGVDGVLWTTPEHKLQAALTLANTKQAAMPLRRVYIPKANGKQRPLGIPTMRDRAYQAVWALALLPVAEELSDKASYGFRPYRSAWDAYAQIHVLLGRQKSGYAAGWVLDADIEGFFDHLSHGWLLENIPMEKRVLHGWLKAGILEFGRFAETDEGTPQGGVISPILANIALTGMEEFLRRQFPPGHSGSGTGRRLHRTQINLVRYADDFVITGRSRRQLERVRNELTQFLAERGLRLSEEKTRIVHIDEGFDFLGWTFRRHNGTFLGQISRDSIKVHKAKLKRLIKSSGNTPVDVLIQGLNAQISGWVNYHRCASGIHNVWPEVDSYVYYVLRHWARKRHRSKPPGWVKRRYWKAIGPRSYVFHGATRHLRKHDARQVRIVRLPAGLNPYRVENRKELAALWTKRRQESLMGDRRALWRSQGGQCLQCGCLIEEPHLADVHHIIPTTAGGANTLRNKQLLHEHCHYRPSNHRLVTAAKASSRTMMKG